MPQFWRPSAWADYLHAYNTWNRMLLGTCGFYIPRHVLIDPYRVGVWNVGMLSFAFGLGYGIYTRTPAFAGFAAMMYTFSRDSGTVLKWNTTLKDLSASANMPTLVHHLRLLVGAQGIIERHVLNSNPQPATSSLLSTSSDLALM